MKNENQKLAKSSSSKEYLQSIKELRGKIDIADKEILEALERRFLVVEEVGKLKKEFSVPALQKARWEEVLQKVIKKGQKNNLSESLVRDIWERIHKEALNIEK